MTPGPEPVRIDPRFSDRRSSGPSWSAIGVFVAGVFTVLSLGLLVGLGWLVVDTREELRQLRNTVKVQEHLINEISKDYAVLVDRTKEP